MSNMRKYIYISSSSRRKMMIIRHCQKILSVAKPKSKGIAAPAAPT